MLRGTLPIGDVEIEVYRLKDGRRLISKGAMARALSLKSEGGNAFLRTVNSTGGRSAIDEKLWEKIDRPIVFSLLGDNSADKLGGTADGYEAVTLIEVCDALLRARQGETLHPSQAFLLAIQAEIIIRSTAKVGINKLVDDAVGYVSDPLRAEYIEMFKDFIAQECQQWKQEFPDKLADMMYLSMVSNDLIRHHQNIPGFSPSSYGSISTFLWQTVGASSWKCSTPGIQSSMPAVVGATSCSSFWKRKLALRRCGSRFGRSLVSETRRVTAARSMQHSTGHSRKQSPPAINGDWTTKMTTRPDHSW